MEFRLFFSPVGSWFEIVWFREFLQIESFYWNIQNLPLSMTPIWDV